MGGVDVDANKLNGEEFALLFKRGASSVPKVETDPTLSDGKPEEKMEEGGKKKKKGKNKKRGKEDVYRELADEDVSVGEEEEIGTEKRDGGIETGKERVTDPELLAAIREAEAHKAAEALGGGESLENLQSTDDEEVKTVAGEEPKKKNEDIKTSELEIKNGLPTSLSSSVETTDEALKKGEVTITHVLALDIIQRVIYSDEEIRLPIVKDGKVVSWEKKKIDSLNILENDTEGHIFNALARHFWKDMVVHGVYDKDGKLRLNSDSDGEVCRYLMNKAGVPIKADGKAYLDFNELRPGAVHMDMGQKNGYCVYLEEVNGKTVVTLIIDHHAPDSKSDISASGWVYMGLAKLGLLENPERFAGLVDFLNKTDNGQPIKEVDEIVNDFNDKHSTKLTKREYLLQELQNTVWGLKRFIKAPKLIEFFEKGRNPLEKLSKRELSGKDGLGVIFEQGAEYKKEGNKRTKVKDGVIIDNQKEFQSHLEYSLNELQKIEKLGLIFESEKYGKIVVDIGGKMVGLGNELSRACGYDGYISWKPEEQSFMLTTRLPLDVDFPQGIKVREHMWMKKTEMGGDLKIGLAEIRKILNGGKEAPWSHGLMNEQVEIKINEAKEIVWEDDVWKDLKLAVGYSPVRNEAQKRLKEKYRIVFDKAAKELKEVQDRLISAINVAVTGKANDLFVDVEMAKNELRKYFGGTEINLNKAADEKKEGVEVKEEQEKDEDKEKYLEYLGGEFLDDLEVLYKHLPKDETSRRKLRDKRSEVLGRWSRDKYGFQRIRKKDEKDIDFDLGRKMVSGIRAFMNLDSGFPKNWEEIKALLEVSKIKVEDLEEARKQKLERDKGKVQGGGEKGEIKGEGEKEMKKELVFDEKEMLREFGEFVKLNGGRTDVWNKWIKDLDTVSEQKKREVIGQLKYAWDLLQNRELRLNDQHFTFWQKYAMSYLRSLGVAGKV